MHLSSGRNMVVAEEGAGDGPSTSCGEEKRVPSYTYSSWKRLRDVCRALQETQEKAARQRGEVDALLADDQECRELAEQVQCKKVELRALQDRVERQKCRIMTCRMKLIRINDERFQKDVMSSKQSDDSAKMQKDLVRRKAALSLTKDNLLLIASHLAWRRRKMVEDLIRIYVISLDTPPAARLVPAPCTCNPVASIVGLHLPDTISLLGHSDTEVSAAVGHVVQVLLLLSRIYNFPYQYSMYFFASRSTITDHVIEETYPLYSRSGNREKFEEGMLLLNRNISQLRWSFGLATWKINKTLPNLQELLLHFVNERSDRMTRVQNRFFSKAFINQQNVRNISSFGSDSFSEGKVDFRQKLSTPARTDFSNFGRRASYGSSKSSLLFDSSTIAAINLASQDNGNDHAKEVSTPAVNSNGVVFG